MRASNRNALKLNDSGAALISVLVVTAFITILAATMLYASAMNLQQKQTDYENKQSFYGAEKALDDLKGILASDMQEAYLEAYRETAKNFLKLENAERRRACFQDKFMESLKTAWVGRVSTSGSLLDAVRGLMTDAAEADCFYKVSGYGVYETTGSGGEKLRKFALKGVQVKFTSGNYTTFLYTDICMEPPVFDWAVEGFTTSADTALKERKRISLTDYISYVNWRKADYDESYNIPIGSEVP